LYPLPVNVNPSTPCLTPVPFLVSETGKFTDDQFTTNWDREFNGNKDRVAVRFFWADSDTFQPFGADSFQIQTGGAPTPNNLNFPLEIPLQQSCRQRHGNASLFQHSGERVPLWN
jgi:hypothetical protein